MIGEEELEDVDVDPADLVAELDDEPDQDVLDAEEGWDEEYEPDLITGLARGGPLDGRTVECRYPKGFLLVDMPAQKVWIYDAAEGPTFVARAGDPMALDDEGRWRAAEEEDFDILVPDDEDEEPPS